MKEFEINNYAEFVVTLTIFLVILHRLDYSIIKNFYITLAGCIVELFLINGRFVFRDKYIIVSKYVFKKK